MSLCQRTDQKLGMKNIQFKGEKCNNDTKKESSSFGSIIVKNVIEIKRTLNKRMTKVVP